MYNHQGNRFHDVERLRSPERIQRLEIERVVQTTLEKSSFKSIIDIGTGSGIFAEAFSKQGLTVTGIDANPEMLTAVRSYVPHADFRQAAAESIAFLDDSFDLAFMGLVLHELMICTKPYRKPAVSAELALWSGNGHTSNRI